MHRKTITIIGCGWLGQALAEALLKNDFEVYGSTRSTTKVRKLEALGVRAHVIDFNAVSLPSLPQAFWESTYFFLNLPPSQRETPADYLAWHRTIWANIQAVNPKAHVIFTSTTGVYGSETGVLNEACAPAPTRASAQAALAVEQYLRTQTAACTILRLSGLVGGQRHPVRYLAGRTGIKRPLDVVNLVHRVDIIRAVEALLLRPTTGIYNLCADAHPTREAYYKAEALRFGLEAPQFEETTCAAPVRQIDNTYFKAVYDFAYRFADPYHFEITPFT